MFLCLLSPQVTSLLLVLLVLAFCELSKVCQKVCFPKSGSLLVFGLSVVVQVKRTQGHSIARGKGISVCAYMLSAILLENNCYKVEKKSSSVKLSDLSELIVKQLCCSWI